MADTRYHLPIIETITTAWSKVYGAKATLWAATGIYLLMVIAGTTISALIGKFSPVVSGIANLAFQVLFTLLIYGQLYIGWKRACDEPIQWQMLWRGLESNRALKLVGVLVLLWLLLLIPTLLAVLTSMGVAMGGADGSTLLKIGVAIIYIACFASVLYIAARAALAPLLVLDRDANPWCAMKLSFHATKRNVLEIIAIYILVTLILAISALPILIGLIWTMPFAYICGGLVYKRLINNAEEHRNNGVCSSPTTRLEK